MRVKRKRAAPGTLSLERRCISFYLKLPRIFSLKKGLGMAELAKVFLFCFFFFLNPSQLVLLGHPRFPTHMSPCPLLHLLSVTSTYHLLRPSPCQAHCTVIFLHFFHLLSMIITISFWKKWHSVLGAMLNTLCVYYPLNPQNAPIFVQKPERVEGLRTWCALTTKKQNSWDWNLAIHHVEAYPL